MKMVPINQSILFKLRPMDARGGIKSRSNTGPSRALPPHLCRTSNGWAKVHHKLARRACLASKPLRSKSFHVILPYSSSLLTFPIPSHVSMLMLIIPHASPFLAPGGRLAAGPGGGSIVSVKVTKCSMLEMLPGVELPVRVRAVTLMSVRRETKFLLSLNQSSRVALMTQIAGEIDGELVAYRNRGRGRLVSVLTDISHMVVWSLEGFHCVKVVGHKGVEVLLDIMQQTLIRVMLDATTVKASPHGVECVCC